MGHNLTEIALNFETDLDHCLDTEDIKDPYFSINLLLCAMEEVCVAVCFCLY